MKTNKLKSVIEQKFKKNVKRVGIASEHKIIVDKIATYALVEFEDGSETYIALEVSAKGHTPLFDNRLNGLVVWNFIEKEYKE